MSDPTPPLNTLSNGVKLVGEALLPGASLLMDGKFADGAAHAVVGIGARLFLGPFGALVVAADSFSKSVANRNLWDYARPAMATAAATVERAASETATAVGGKTKAS